MIYIYTHCIYNISIYDYREGSLVVNYTIHIYTHCIFNISIYDYREGSLVVNYTLEVDDTHTHTVFTT